MPQLSRIDPEMSNGILESGVVTEAREIRPQIAMELRRLFAGEERASRASHRRFFRCGVHPGARASK